MVSAAAGRAARASRAVLDQRIRGIGLLLDEEGDTPLDAASTHEGYSRPGMPYRRLSSRLRRHSGISFSSMRVPIRRRGAKTPVRPKALQRWATRRRLSWEASDAPGSVRASA